MASPAVAGTTEGALGSAGANVAVTLPAGGSASDGYLVIIAKGSVSCTINALTDWAEALDEAAATGLVVLWYTGAGVPSNPTFVQSASSRSAWAAYRITGTDRTVTPTVGTTATGSSINPNPPSATVTAGPKDVLAIAVFSRGGEIADDDSLVSAFPTNYTDGQVEKSAGTVGTNLAGIIGAAARQISAASSEDPGTFTAATGAWRAQTIIVYPAAAGTPYTHSQPDAIAGTDASTRRVTKPQADAIAGTDARSLAAVHPAGDTGTLTDDVQTVLGRSHTQQVGDSIAGTDATVKRPTHLQADPLAATDSLARAIARLQADLLAGTDAFAKGNTHTLSDALTAADSLARLWAALLTLPDQAALTDAVIPSAAGATNWTRAVDDGAVLGDLAAMQTVFVRVIGDEAGVSEELASQIEEIFEFNWAHTSEVNWRND